MYAPSLGGKRVFSSPLRGMPAMPKSALAQALQIRHFRSLDFQLDQQLFQIARNNFPVWQISSPDSSNS
jgi:hypothetical protein